MNRLTSVFALLLTLVSTLAFANDRAGRVATIADGIKNISECKNFLKKPVVDKSNAVGDHPYRVNASLYNGLITVSNPGGSTGVRTLKIDNETLELREKSTDQKAQATIKFSKDPIGFLSELDNLEQIIEGTLEAAQAVEEDENHSQGKIDTYVEELGCSLNVVQLIKKEYSKK